MFFDDIVVKNNLPVMVALELNPTTRNGKPYLDIVKNASVYTSSNTQNLINSSNVKYIDKKETESPIG